MKLDGLGHWYLTYKSTIYRIWIPVNEKYPSIYGRVFVFYFASLHYLSEIGFYFTLNVTSDWEFINWGYGEGYILKYIIRISHLLDVRLYVT